MESRLHTIAKFVGGIMVFTGLGQAVGSTTEVIAPAYLFATNHVADGMEDVQSERVLIAYDSILYKLGGGQWTLPVSFLLQPWDAAFAVQEGTLALGVGTSQGSYVSPTDLPASVKAKALIWVDANDDAKVVRTGDAVSSWFDHRESDIANQQYVRADTYNGYTNIAPQYATIEGGRKAVYFGRFASGVTMKFFKPDGTDCTGAVHPVDTAVKQVFAVMSNSNSYGNVFGTHRSDYVSPFRIGNETSAASSLSGYYFYSSSSGNGNNAYEMMMDGRAYLNGVRIDPTLTYVEKGVQLLEAEVKALSCNSLVSGFFAGSSKEKSGGDYLCEAIAFTNQLTEAERLAVEEYLMAKWLPDAGKHCKRIALADDTALSVNVAQGETVVSHLALSGTGSAEKTGDGELRLRNGLSDGGVEWDVKGGSMVLGAYAPIKVSAGQRVTVENVVAGPRLAIAAHSSSTTLEKDGNDSLSVNGVPSGVKRICVNGGTLNVRPPRTDSVVGESAYEVPIRNGGFEDYADVIASKRADGSRVESVANMTGYGWAVAEGGASVFDYDGWNTGNGSMGGTRSAFNINTRPPEGRCALAISAQNNRSTVRSAAFALADTGDYCLVFKMCGRQSTSYFGGELRVRILGGSTSTVYGPTYRCRYAYLDGYHEYQLKFPSLAVGSYRIEFSAAQASYVLTVDDVHLYKVPSDPLAADRWAIPGGDFETQNVPFKKIRSFSADWTVDGWTFTQPDGWTYSLPAIGVTTLATTNTASTQRGVLYNNSREPESGSMQLCFCGDNATAETAIKPPAGTYRLEGYISRFGSYGYYPKLSARIIRTNGDEIDLGTFEQTNKRMKRFGWPVPFAVDGNESVTLRFTVSGTMNRVNHFTTGILLDDVELVAATDMELFTGGACDRCTLWSDSSTGPKYIAATDFGCSTGRVRSRSDTEAPEAFGSEMVDGHNMLAIGNRSYLYEDVQLPFAGRYRLSFYAKSRMVGWKDGAYGPNPLEVTLVSGTKTNVLGRVDTYNSDWAQRVYDFSVPSGGVYRIAFQGLHNPSDPNAEHEAHIDAISLRQVHETHDLTPPFDDDTRIYIAEGARLETDFTGTNVIKALRLGTTRCADIVDVADYPHYLSGRGVFKIVPNGITLSFR